MAETKIEETVEDQLLNKEEIAEVESLKDKKDEELTPEQKANRKLFARMSDYKNKLAESKKSHEDEISKLNAKIKELEEKGKPIEDLKKEKEAIEQQLDPVKFAKEVRGLSQLDDDELAYAEILSKGMGKTIKEVITTEQFKTWADGNKTKKENEKKILDTTNKKANDGKVDPVVQKWTDNLPSRFKPKN